MPEKNKPVQIGILEIRRHIPVLHTHINICTTKHSHVTVFTTPDLHTRLKTYETTPPKYTLILKEPKESIPTYLKRVEHYANTHLDALLINTIHEYTPDLLSYLSFKPTIPTILTIHHINAWLKPTYLFHPQQPLKTFETNLTSFIIKHKIMPKINAINVIYHPLTQYIKTHTTNTKPIFTLPTSVYHPTTTHHTHQPNTPIHITIPGLIQEHRKDYTPILQALQNLPKDTLQQLHISLPGLPVGTYGKNIVSSFHQLTQKGLTLQTFNEFVPDDQFNTILQHSDIILAPIKIQTRADTLITEYYGQTVGSGVIYNAIQYAKPLILPKTFNHLPELTSSTQTYTTHHDLQTILTTLTTNQHQLLTLQKNARHNAEKLSLTNLQHYYTTTILPWITQHQEAPHP